MAVTVYGVLVAVGLAWVAYSKPLDQKTSTSKEVRMPNVQPQVKDTYLCYAAPKQKEDLYITGFQPHANMSTAHHILLYGCDEPGSEQTVWDCGEMHGTGGGYTEGPVCKSGAQIIYAWAMDAPQLTMPPGVAFKIYGKSGINQLVLQVHYKKVDQFLPPNNHTDSSGITLVTTTTPQPKRAGVYLLGAGGEIAPRSTVYMETACSVNDPFEVHPFAYRAHAHTHGEVISGYRVRNGKWEELGRVSPKLPEMFYNVSNPDITIKSGDILAARCTMVNNEDRTVAVGDTANDEMCNFYLMYWVDGDRQMKERYCFSPGPPLWNWDSFEGLNAAAVPQDASIVPGTSKLLKATEQMMKNTEKFLQEQNKQLDLDVEDFLQGMRQRFGNFVYEVDEQLPETLQGGADGGDMDVDLSYLDPRVSRSESPDVRDLLDMLYQDGYNKAYRDVEEENLPFDPRSLRDYPDNTNPWLQEADDDNYY